MIGRVLTVLLLVGVIGCSTPDAPKRPASAKPTTPPLTELQLEKAQVCIDLVKRVEPGSLKQAAMRRDCLTEQGFTTEEIQQLKRQLGDRFYR